MKYSMIAVPVLGLLYGVGVGAAEEPAGTTAEASQGTGSVDITTDEEKVNYSLGYELGKDLKDQQLQLLPEALLQGAEDAISGGKALVRPTQRAAALKQIKEKRAQASLEQSQAFLAENAKKEGVVTLDSGLQYKEIQPGEGKIPQATDSVTVNYRGTLINGTEFTDSSELGKPATYQMKKVIKGWREALLLMKEGAKWELYIPPQLAYGKRGMRKIIPPNSALIYEVELISVK
mgnify:FL=1